MHIPKGNTAKRKEPATMKDYSGYTNEELVSLITNGEEEAYEQLFANMRPLTMREAAPYHKKNGNLR